MNEVKKYDMDQTGCDIEDPDGGWVRASDFDALRAENERLREERDSHQRDSIRARLELAALKAVPEGVEAVAFIQTGNGMKPVARIGTPADLYFPGGDASGYTFKPLMTVAQHNAIVAGLGDPAGSFDKCMQAMQDRDEHAKTIDKLRLELHALRQPVAGEREAEQDDALRITPPSIRGTPPCSTDCRLPACRARLAELETREREAFEVEIPEISATFDGLHLIPMVPLKAGEHLMTIAQHLRIEKQLRAALSAPAAGQQPTAYLIEGCGTVTLQYKERPAWADGDPTLTVTPLYEGAGQDVSALVEALEHARQFIRNGVELGYIQMPDVDTPDPAHDTLPKIDAALAAHKAGGGDHE